MERLQAAIEKARAQRAAQQAGLPAGPAAPLILERGPDGAAVDAAWEALPAFDLRPRWLSRHRVLSVAGGTEAAPYDILRTRLIQQAQSHGWKRIAVVSPHSGGGKTTTVANLAFGMARQRGIRSIVMDFDLRRGGSLGHVLGQKGNIPMGDVLEERVPFSEVARRHGKSLAFGLGFGTAKSPAEILQSDRTQAVLAGIEATYAPDFMIFDLPPLSAGDDNLGFLSRVDAALILAEAGKTSLTQIDVSERQVAELTNVMGIVLNKCRYVSGAYGYEDGYY